MREIKESVILIRHGRSQHNTGELDSLDSPLSHFGEVQARTVGKYLKSGAMGDLRNYVVRVSPFLRCVMTANLIREEAGDMLADCLFMFDPLVAEYLAPHNDPVELPDRQKDFPYMQWIGEPYLLHKPEFGEHFLRRMHKAHDNLSPKSIVISHGMPCLTLAQELQGPLQYIPAWDHSINNCSITWVEDGRKKWYGRNLHHEVSYQDNLSFNV
jgi:broad specificity phosphatase PhoE